MSSSSPRKLWSPSNPKATTLWRFKSTIESHYSVSLPTYNDLYTWSITHRSDFWTHCLTYFPIIYRGTIPSPCVDESAPIQSVPVWFKGVKLNFAENVLFSRGGDGGGIAGVVGKRGKEDEKVAVTEVRENPSSSSSFSSGSSAESIRTLTWSALRTRVAILSMVLRARGVRKGDRIALIAGTSIDTLVTFLATASLGAIFSSSSTDMGVTGLLDRLLQIRPKFVFFDDAAVYNGKYIDLRQKIAEVIRGMEGVKEFEKVVLQPRFAGQSIKLEDGQVPEGKTETLERFISPVVDQKNGNATTDAQLHFEPCAFNDPLLIVYSSGTTGPPKCIVHSHGGIILNGHKEGQLHREITPASVQLQYTTTGWIMYLASVQIMLTGAQMVAYDGSPFYPDQKILLRLVEKLGVTHLGVSPRYLGTLQQERIVPKKVADLTRLKVVTCTGSVLSEKLFEWFYSDEGFVGTTQLDNISGGTDLAGAWGTGNPILPVYSGGCQCLSLGMKVEVFEDADAGEKDVGGETRKGQSVPGGQPGNLVCSAAFPSMPVFFWGDQGGKKYYDSYFARYDGVWTHGDFIQIHPTTGQVMFLGRADGVLNPSGVRFGSSEIYGVIEAHFSSEIADTICVGQRRAGKDTDERVLLFVLMREGRSFGPALVKRIKSVVARELSKRHVPKFVFETEEIPLTVNGKKVELPVKRIVSGEKVKVSGTLANPASLKYYERFAEDENLVEMESARL